MEKTRPRAAALALHLVAALQAISLIRNALGEPEAIVTKSWPNWRKMASS